MCWARTYSAARLPAWNRNCPGGALQKTAAYNHQQIRFVCQTAAGALGLLGRAVQRGRDEPAILRRGRPQRNPSVAPRIMRRPACWRSSFRRHSRYSTMVESSSSSSCNRALRFIHRPARTGSNQAREACLDEKTLSRARGGQKLGKPGLSGTAGADAKLIRYKVAIKTAFDSEKLFFLGKHNRNSADYGWLLAFLISQTELEHALAHAADYVFYAVVGDVASFPCSSWQ